MNGDAQEDQVHAGVAGDALYDIFPLPFPGLEGVVGVGQERTPQGDYIRIVLIQYCLGQAGIVYPAYGYHGHIDAPLHFRGVLDYAARLHEGRLGGIFRGAVVACGDVYAVHSRLLEQLCYRPGVIRSDAALFNLAAGDAEEHGIIRPQLLSGQLHDIHPEPGALVHISAILIRALVGER